MNVQRSYPYLSQKATSITFAYMCETAFSALVNMKTKYRFRLAAEFELQVDLSQIAPRFDKLCSKKQPHPSIALMLSVLLVLINII